MTAQRDPHLPPPEVCDWLLAQEWSKPMEIQAIAAIGRDEYIDLMLPVEALQLLKEDAAAREQRRADESDGEKLYPETTLLQQVLADAILLPIHQLAPSAC